MTHAENESFGFKREDIVRDRNARRMHDFPLLLRAHRSRDLIKARNRLPDHPFWIGFELRLVRSVWAGAGQRPSAGMHGLFDLETPTLADSSVVGHLRRVEFPLADSDSERRCVHSNHGAMPASRGVSSKQGQDCSNTM